MLLEQDVGTRFVDLAVVDIGTAFKVGGLDRVGPTR